MLGRLLRAFVVMGALLGAQMAFETLWLTALVAGGAAALLPAPSETRPQGPHGLFASPLIRRPGKRRRH
ncbi:MAG: hypothetical protein WA840_12300 [Caulobacteraceae bacterium]